MDAKSISIVVPVFDEELNLDPLMAEINAALEKMSQSFEVIFVDDGSTDGSFDVLQRLSERDCNVTVVRLRRNHGQSAAFAAGFDQATGDLILTMDADRQNDPADIPRLVDKIAEGFDVVNGWRHRRQDGLITRRLPSLLANTLIAYMTGVPVRDRGCSLRLFRSEVIRELHLYGELHRFIPEMVSFAGFKMTELPVNHRHRVAGRSKYGMSRTIRVILDLITMLYLRRYSDRPMQLLGGLGILLGSTGLAFGLYLTWLKIWAGIQGGWEGFNNMRIGERPLLLLAVLLIIVGVQFLVMGLIAELIVRTYYETQNKPIYHVREIIGGDSERGIG